MGAQLESLGTFLEATVTGTGLSRDTRLLLETLADQLKNPAFAPEEIEKAKAEIEKIRGPSVTKSDRVRKAG